jgi:hypothetical protein
MFRLPANLLTALLDMKLIAKSGHLVSLISSAMLLILSTGCAHPPDSRSERHKQAFEWSVQGEKAYLSGNIVQSRHHYAKALQLNSSIENSRGIAANLLSLAQINIEQGEYTQADNHLQRILGDKNALFTDTEKADATVRAAQIALLLQQAGKSAQLAHQAQLLCQAANCTLGAAIRNLHAQAALKLGLIQDATALARQAETLADKIHQPIELANSRRLLGEIQLKQNLASTAIPLLEQALNIDKQLGLTRKIAEDLHLLADATTMLGQSQQAESYRSREHAILQTLSEKLQ